MIIPIDRALRYDDRGDLRSWYQTIKALKGTEVTEETCRRGTQFLAAYVGARLLGKGLQLGEGPIANLAKTNLQQEVGKVIYLSENGSLAYTTVTPKEFMDVFSKVQAEKSTLLKARSLAEMEDIFQKGGRFYLASGNEGVNAKAGFVVSGNGEIFSAFNTTRNKLQSVQVLREAKKLGIKKLVCMDNVADPRSSPCALYRLVMRSVPGMREVESIPMTRTERPDLGAIPDEAFKDLRKVSFTFED